MKTCCRTNMRLRRKRSSSIALKEGQSFIKRKEQRGKESGVFEEDASRGHRKHREFGVNMKTCWKMEEDV
ncbi:hypothetical protein [Bartonella sp. TT67HLJMS]|uniref:hypothetical protein n=1 Tax=Bartonella sp. TT67HLJMS TaxID=3243582 RepID=UPI0035D0C158